MKHIKMWVIRTFRVIHINEAEKLSLGFYRNVYGDEINHLGCRSIWCDDDAKQYRVHELVTNGRK